MADRGPQGALVDVVLAELARVRRRADALVPVDVVDARRPVLAQVARTVVYVLLAVLTQETCNVQTTD